MGESRRVLLLGGSGMLGSALRADCPPGVTLLAPTHGELDATDPTALAAEIELARPEWVINCVAYTAVDLAEREPERAQVLNAGVPELLGELAAPLGLRVLHVSTDYVFGHEATRPRREDDACAPTSVYGRSKLAGERALLASGAESLIVRTAWLYGDPGKNFPRTMWERATSGQASRVVDDQRGASTAAKDLARWCWQLIARDARGIVHASNAGEASWADVAEYVYAAAGRVGLVTRVSSAEYPTPAERPRYSVLDGSRLEQLLGQPRRHWQAALDEYLQVLQQGTRA